MYILHNFTFEKRVKLREWQATYNSIAPLCIITNIGISFLHVSHIFRITFLSKFFVELSIGDVKNICNK